jgi:hypothetical protein
MAVQLLGLCNEEICVLTEGGQRYRYDPANCNHSNDQTCWVAATSDQVTPLVPQLYNPCLYEYQIPSPPGDAIQVMGSKVCESGGDGYVYYSLLENGSVWEWNHSIADLASLLYVGLAYRGIVVGFLVGITISIFAYALLWPRLSSATT